MIVMGVDPGIATTGVAFICEKKGQLNFLYAKAIVTSPSLSIPARLLNLVKPLRLMIEKFQPDVLVLEHLFFNTNAKTALIIGQARGAVQLTSAMHNIPVIEYTPLQVKTALTGYGRADKSQIQKMVKSILKLPKILSPDDVADAAAIALTHCFSYKMNTKRLVKSV